MPRPKLDGGPAYESQPEFLKKSLNRRRYAWRWDTPEKYDRNMRNYLRMLTGLDRNIGRVIEALEALGLADNTVIIFMGDNGYYMGERGFAGKWSHYDESLRVPLVIYDPRLPTAMRGRVVESIALNLDVAPTILDMAGIESKESRQGRSLVPWVRRTNVEDQRTGFFCEHRMKHAEIPRWQGYRTTRYMYANYFDQPASNEFLHDLEADPDQLVNLAADNANASVLEKMRNECRRLSALYAAEAEPLPRVLLLGDSISMGYHRFVVDALADEAKVVRPKENCAGTSKGIQKIDEWRALDGGGFDVIHFNFGLHDLKRVKESGKNSNDPADPHQADLAAYERNLRQIVAHLKTTGASLIFATTTPFPPGVKPYRDPADAARYNAVARKIMEENDVVINDLYGRALGKLAELQQRVNVHFTTKGSEWLGDQVSRVVRTAVRKR